MRSKKSWFNGALFADILKRYWWFGFITLLTFLFAVPVWVSALVQNNMAIVARTGDPAVLERLLAGFFYGMPQYITSDVVLSLIFGAAAGLVFFGYLHNKKQVDFYHGQPVTRRTLLVTRYAAGLVLFMLPYLLNLLIAYFILLGAGAPAATFGLLLLRAGLILVCFGLLYAVSILCAALTGNPFAHLEAGFLVCFGVSLLICCWEWLCGTFFSTYSRIGESPAVYTSAPVHLIYEVSNGTLTGVIVLLYVLLTALVLFLALRAYDKRPSESVGCTLVFRWSEPVFRAVFTVLVSVFVASILHSINRSMGFLVFGAAMGAFLGHIFTQGQIKRSFGGMFTAWVPFAAACAVIAVCIGCFSLDVTGYDAYVPDRAEVSRAALNLYNDSSIRVETYDPETGEQLDVMETGYAYDDPGVMDEIHALAAAGAAAAELDESVRGANTYTYNYLIRFTLSNGRQVQRLYKVVPREAVGNTVRALLREPDYIERNSIFEVEPDKCVFAAVGMSASRGESYYVEAADRARLVQALQADIAVHGVPCDEPTNLWAELSYYTGEESRMGNVPRPTMAAFEKEAYALAEEYISVPIPASYTQTMALLDEWGVNAEEELAALLPDVTRVEIRDYDGKVFFETDDPARMASILQSGVLTSDMSGLLLLDPYSVTATMRTPRDDREIYYGVMLHGIEKLGVRP